MGKKKVKFLGENLLQFRKEKGLSQEELANKIGVSRQAVYKWETTSKMPDIENLILLCKEFDKNIEDFVEGADLLAGKKEKSSVEKKINFKKFILVFLFIIFCIYVIIEMMVHYSSNFDYYEGGAKNPLKGTSMKLVIDARNAQFCVLVGRKNIGRYIMAYILAPVFAET